MTTSRITFVAVAISIISSGSAFATNRMSAGKSEGCPNYESWTVYSGSCQEDFRQDCITRVNAAHPPAGTCTVNVSGNTCVNYAEDGYYLTCNLQP